MHALFRILTFVCLTGLGVLFNAGAVNAEKGATIIRDTEIERTIKSWAEPVMTGAGYTVDQINLVIVEDNAVNAFVAGGPNIFFTPVFFWKARTRPKSSA